MGGKSSKDVSQVLGQEKRNLENKVAVFEQQAFNDKLRVPIRHFFVKKKKFYICDKEDSNKFLSQISKVAKDAVQCYQGAFSPSMIGDLTDLLGSILGSSSGEDSEESLYFVSKMGKGCVRTDFFISSKKIIIDSSSKSTTIAFCISMTISSIESSELDQNEKHIVEAIEPPKMDDKPATTNLQEIKTEN